MYYVFDMYMWSCERIGCRFDRLYGRFPHQSIGANICLIDSIMNLAGDYSTCNRRTKQISQIFKQHLFLLSFFFKYSRSEKRKHFSE